MRASLDDSLAMVAVHREPVRRSNSASRRRKGHASRHKTHPSRHCTPPATPPPLRLTPFQRRPNSSRSTSSWGSAIQGGSTETLAAEQARNAVPSVALAGLRLFLTERCGSLWEAFQRMDFHHDSRVSCLEFQEVVSGQESYCDLREARELFCLLARGTDGWLKWDDFCSGLGSREQAGMNASSVQWRSEAHEDALGSDCESRGSWASRGTSESNSSRAASNALRSLLFGRRGLACRDSVGQDASKHGDADGDEAATTVHTLTSRSSQSCPALRSMQHGLPQSCAATPSNALVAWQHSGEGDHDAGSMASLRSMQSMPSYTQLASAEERLAPPPGGSIQHALKGGSDEMAKWLLDGLGDPHMDSRSFASASPSKAANDSRLNIALDNKTFLDGKPQGLSPNKPLVDPGQSFDMTCLGQTPALLQLDASLLAWRTEVAALQSLVAGPAFGGAGNATSRSSSVPGLSATPSAPTPVAQSNFVEAAGAPLASEATSSINSPAAPKESSEFATATAAESLFSHSAEKQGLVGAAHSRAVPWAGSTFQASGLPWVKQLPYHTQGRLAACRSMAGALELLDEALDALPLPEAAETDASFCGDTTSQGRCSRGRWRRSKSKACEAPPLAPRSRGNNDASRSADLVAASAELLRGARAHAASLEEEFRERQLRHEQHVAEVCRRQRRERRRALRSLLDRLSPPARMPPQGPVQQQMLTPSDALSTDVSPHPRGAQSADTSLEHVTVPPLPPYRESRRERSMRSPARCGSLPRGAWPRSLADVTNDPGTRSSSKDVRVALCTDMSGIDESVEPATRS